MPKVAIKMVFFSKISEKESILRGVVYAKEFYYCFTDVFVE